MQCVICLAVGIVRKRRGFRHNEAVCRLLGDAANGRPLALQTIPEEALLRGFCNAHRLTTLVSCALRDSGVSEEDHRALHAEADVQAFHQIKADAMAQAVLERMREASLTPLLLKGAALQAVYPAGWVRTATDTDCCIPTAQLQAAKDVLLSMGFVPHSSQEEQHSFQKPPRYHIELHTSLGGFSARERRVLERLAAKQDFSLNEHYVYTLFHLYKHFVHVGAGVRMFLDMYCLSRAITDRTYIDSLLKELDLAAFDGDACTAPFADVIDYLLQSTTFGNSDIYHALNAVGRTATRPNRLAVWLTYYGFDRTAMTARYPILAKQLWLYPFCSVHRVTNGLLHKRTVLRTAYKAKHAADRRQIRQVLQTVGIL